MDTSTEPTNPFLKHLYTDEVFLWLGKPNQSFRAAKLADFVLYKCGIPCLAIFLCTIIFSKELGADVLREPCMIVLLIGIGVGSHLIRKDSISSIGYCYAVTNRRILEYVSYEVGDVDKEEYRVYNLKDMDFSKMTVTPETAEGIGTIIYKPVRDRKGLRFENIDDVEKVAALIRIARDEAGSVPEVAKTAAKTFSPL